MKSWGVRWRTCCRWVWIIYFGWILLSHFGLTGIFVLYLYLYFPLISLLLSSAHSISLHFLSVLQLIDIQLVFGVNWMSLSITLGVKQQLDEATNQLQPADGPWDVRLPVCPSACLSLNLPFQISTTWPCISINNQFIKNKTQKEKHWGKEGEAVICQFRKTMKNSKKSKTWRWRREDERIHGLKEGRMGERGGAKWYNYWLRDANRERDGRHVM